MPAAPLPPAVHDRTAGAAAAPPAGPARALPWVLTVGGAAGLLAAVDLTYERLRLALDPTYVPTCSVNPLIDCGTVASSPQASVLGGGFPNTLLGVVGFSVVLTLGVLALCGVALPRPVRWGLQAGVLAGLAFVHWLVGVSVFVLGVLCPYCMVVWVVVVVLAVYVTLTNAVDGLLGRRVADSELVRTLATLHAAPAVVWVAGLVALLGVVFAEQWAAMLA
ncbi:vitamin K epoxide reductase family protein [Aquipuribacter hungaricus]|uniref:Vitamin K epoxide reductase family protein n=2 Tax=Aquipuribacter hungaricus TaxID=545624 RepID=A0ABV7WF49_9MICO